MTMFYDPLKKHPRYWVIISLIIVPIILIILLVIGTKGLVEKKKTENAQETTSDIFK